MSTDSHCVESAKTSHRHHRAKCLSWLYAYNLKAVFSASNGSDRDVVTDRRPHRADDGAGLADAYCLANTKVDRVALVRGRLALSDAVSCDDREKKCDQRDI